MIRYCSTTSKKVTRSSLVSEMYKIVAGADIRHTITTTINQIFTQLSIPSIHKIMYTDPYSLYECVVKLESIKKRPMIDFMGVRQ